MQTKLEEIREAMDEHDCTWWIDIRGFLIAPSGGQVARISTHALWLYDKRTKTEWPLSPEQLARLIAAMQKHRA